MQLTSCGGVTLWQWTKNRHLDISSYQAKVGRKGRYFGCLLWKRVDNWLILAQMGGTFARDHKANIERYSASDIPP